MSENDYDAKVAALRAERDAARSDLVASAQTAARFERERDELDAENLRLREQAGDMAGQVEELRASLRDEVGEVIRLTAVVAALRADVGTLLAEVAALRAVVDEVAWMFRGTGEAEDGVHVTATGVARLLALLDALPPSDRP